MLALNGVDSHRFSAIEGVYFLAATLSLSAGWPLGLLCSLRCCFHTNTEDKRSLTAVKRVYNEVLEVSINSSEFFCFLIPISVLE